MCDILNELYKEMNNTEFDYNQIDDRIVLQKIVYLLMNMGINVGNYSFEWSKYGPYSIALDADAYKNYMKNTNKEVIFSDVAIEKMSSIKSFIKEGRENYGGYTTVRWLEAIASVHYLKYVLRIGENPKDIVSELKNRKPYLDNNDANNRAVQIAEQIESI